MMSHFMLKKISSHQWFVAFFLVECKFLLLCLFFSFDLPIEVILSAILFLIKSPVASAVFWTTLLGAVFAAAIPVAVSFNFVPYLLPHFLANDKNPYPLTLFRMGGGGRQKGPPTGFCAVTSTNVGFGLQNFQTFRLNPFATLVQNFKFVLSASPKLLNLNQDHLLKKAIFLVKSL